MRSEASAARERRRQRMRCPKERKRRFLDHLAETYDVDGACAAAWLCWIDMCQLRDEEPDFAAKWDRIIAAGYERIEIMLLRLGGAAGGEQELAPDIAVARELVKRRAVRRARPGAAAPKPNKEREIAAIMRRLGAIGPANDRKDDADEAGAAVAGLVGGTRLASPRKGKRQAQAAPGPAG